MSHAVRDGRGAVFQTVGDAFVQNLTQLLPHLRRDVLAHHIAPERQGKFPGAFPPLAEVEDVDESLAGVGELAFVNDEADVRLARMNGFEDLIEGLLSNALTAANSGEIAPSARELLIELATTATRRSH